MTERALVYYWVEWRNGWVDDEPQSRPGPLVGEWDGKVWWFTRLESYRFDSQVEVVAECPLPPLRPEAHLLRPELRSASAKDKQQAA